MTLNLQTRRKTLTTCTNTHARTRTHTHLITILEVEVARLGMIAEVNTFTIVSDDVLGTRILVVSPGNKLLHSENRRVSGSNVSEIVV